MKTIIKEIIRAVGRANRKQISWTILIGFVSAIFEVLGVGAIVPLITLILDRKSLVKFIEK